MSASPTPEDALQGIGRTLDGQSVRLGDKQISRASLADQIKAHRHLQDQAMRTARKRPTLSSIDMSGAF